MLVSRPVAVALALLCGSSSAVGTVCAQTPAPDSPPAEALRVQYADGKSMVQSIKARGSFYTVNFPRVPDANTDRNGVRLAAMHLRYMRDAQGLRVQFGLSYGSATTNIETVAETRLSGPTPVTVQELRAFGVEPVTLSIVPIREMNVAPPETVSPSSQIELYAEPLGQSGVSYRVTVRNRSNVGLRWFEYVAQRGSRPVVSGSKRGPLGGVLVDPAGEYAFDLTVAPGSKEADGQYVADPIQRIEIVSMLWEDGVVEGDRGRAARHAQTVRGHMAQLQGLLKVLGTAPTPPIPSLRTTISRYLGSDFEMQGLEARFLEQLDAIERTGKTPAGLDLAAWLKATIAECEGWLNRIVMPKL